MVRANGGFKTDSPNYVGESVVGNCKDVLKSLGIILGPDGIVTPMLFDTLPMVEQEKALKVYVERAKRGVEDAALLVGTGKDLLEAVSEYVFKHFLCLYCHSIGHRVLFDEHLTEYNIGENVSQSSF